MADRMRVTSLIGGTTSRQVLSATRETAHEYTIPPATSPRLLWRTLPITRSGCGFRTGCGGTARAVDRLRISAGMDTPPAAHRVAVPSIVVPDGADAAVPGEQGIGAVAEQIEVEGLVGLLLAVA